jgi:hypothetical protein
VSRVRAASIHLGICGAVALLLLALFWFVWYPAPLFEAIGGTDVFVLLLGVDIVLGPLLTFVVFKPGKKSLKSDLAAIGVVQMLALCFGVFTLFSARPVYVAALGVRFEVVQAHEIDRAELKAASQSLPLFGPKWVGIKRPEDPNEQNRVLMSSLGGVDYGHFPQHHQPIENMRETILKHAQSIAELKKLNSGKEADIDQWISSRGLVPNNVRFQGLKARAKDFAVMLDANTAEVLGVAPFRSW